MRYIGLFILLIFIGCSESKPEKFITTPDELIEESTFKELLYELYLVEGMYYRNDVLKFNLDTLAMYHISLFNKFEVEPIHFKQSYDYYHSDAEKMNVMYDEMIAEYQVLKSKIDLLEDPIDSVALKSGNVVQENDVVSIKKTKPQKFTKGTRSIKEKKRMNKNKPKK